MNRLITPVGSWGRPSAGRFAFGLRKIDRAACMARACRTTVPNVPNPVRHHSLAAPSV